MLGHGRLSTPLSGLTFLEPSARGDAEMMAPATHPIGKTDTQGRSLAGAFNSVILALTYALTS